MWSVDCYSLSSIGLTFVDTSFLKTFFVVPQIVIHVRVVKTGQLKLIRTDTLRPIKTLYPKWTLVPLEYFGYRMYKQDQAKFAIRPF